MAIKLKMTIQGETAAQVMLELAAIGSRAVEGLGVGPHGDDTLTVLDAVMPEGQSAGKGITKGKARVRNVKPNGPEPESEAVKLETAKIDRAAIIDGLTKIYSKGDPDVRLAITKFRDGQGADRLRDLKDDALPAAAELLTELKLAESASAV